MRTILPFFISCCLSLAGICLQAQQNRPEQGKEPGIDKRVWNHNYWRQLIRHNAAPANATPSRDIKPALTRNIGGPLKLDDNLSVFLGANIVITQTGNEKNNAYSVCVHGQDHNIVMHAGSTLRGVYICMSHDGGLNWSQVAPQAVCANLCDPVVAVDGKGRFYVVGNQFLDASADAYALRMLYTDDHGESWQSVVLPASQGMPDRHHVAVDPAQGYVYAAWTCLAPGNKETDGQIMFSRSLDRGVSWSQPIAVSKGVEAGSHNQGVAVHTGPQGEVYVVWAIYDSFPAAETALGFCVSADNGKTFSTARRIVQNLRGIRHGVAGDWRLHSFPSLAVDVSGGARNGNIYVAWNTASGNDKTCDVVFSYSADQGNNWSAAQCIHPQSANRNKRHLLPAITCDAETGILGALFYTDRHVTSGAYEIFAAVCVDGKTWFDFPLGNASLTPQPLSGYAPGHFSDAPCLGASDGRFYACWTTNAGETEKAAATDSSTAVSALFIVSTDAPVDNKPAERRSWCGATGIEAALLLALWMLLRSLSKNSRVRRNG